jgi:hypothetical protein
LVFQESENEIEDEVDILMSSDIVAVQMSTRLITFNRTQTGFFFKEDKTVGKTSLKEGMKNQFKLIHLFPGNGWTLSGGILFDQRFSSRVAQEAGTPYSRGSSKEQSLN